MFFFPTHTDRRLKRTPWVNYTLIAVNAIVFLFTERMVQAHDPRVAEYYLASLSPRLIQFICYQFLHANVWHVLGNMLFLYVFGNAVEDRLGRIGYLLFYLAGGVIAGIGHIMTSVHPVLGASGAVAAVTGAYLALFPMSNVTIVYWFFFIGRFEVSSMLLILFRVAQDLLFQFGGVGNTAYMAHLAGYAVGFIVGIGLLFTRLLSRESYDMLSMIEHRRRRAQFQRMTQRGYRPWQGAAGRSRPGEPTVKLSPQDEQIMTLRSKISEAFDRHDLPAAAKGYAELLDRDAAQVLSQQQQLDVANQLMSEGRYDTAAAAYDRFMEHYTRYAEKYHIQLILGLILGRYLDQSDRARELLVAALPKLAGEDLQLAKSVLDELPAPSS